MGGREREGKEREGSLGTQYRLRATAVLWKSTL